LIHVRASIASLVLVLWALAAGAQDRFFDSAGARLRYVEQGAGAPVVLLHGFTADIERAWMQTDVMPKLARDYRVIALDLRGHGRSDKPRDARAYEGLALDVIRLLDHLGIERAHAVGYSLGGIILARLLATHEERFLSVTLAAAAYRRSQSERADHAAEAEAREIEQRGLFRALVVSTAPTDEAPPDEQAIRQRSDSIALYNDRFALAALMRARRALLVTDAQMAAVRVPVLALVGSADPQAERVKAMQRAWPALRVEVVPGATHPTVHPRSLIRRPELVGALRRHMAR
jgi:pimeloyl-ACP methyl ester carboxylesterase